MKILGVFITLLLAQTLASAAQDDGLDFSQSEVIKAGYFSLSDEVNGAGYAKYTPRTQKDAPSCIHTANQNENREYEVRVESGYLKTDENPDKFGANDAGLFVSVYEESRNSISKDSAFVPISIYRNVHLKTGQNIGSQNRLVYKSGSLADAESPIRVGIRIVEFDAEGDVTFDLLEKMSDASQTILSQGASAAMTLAPIASYLIQSGKKNDVIGEGDITLMPCLRLGALPLPPIAEGYIVLLRDKEDRRNAVNWESVVYDPSKKILLVRKRMCGGVEITELDGKCQAGELYTEEFQQEFRGKTYVVLSIIRR